MSDNPWLNDPDVNAAYLRKSMVKTEQQKALEELLTTLEFEPQRIADIACGGGTLTFHLRQKYPAADFVLIDAAQMSLEIARDINRDGVRYKRGDVYALGCKDDTFDLTFCWQTLSWLDNPEQAIRELVRVTRPGGKVYASSLFNIRHDVDIYAKAFDYTLESGRNGLAYNYNTYSQFSVERWLDGRASGFRIVEFNPEVDFTHAGRGVGTFTIATPERRLQVSAGILMNWGILEVTK